MVSINLNSTKVLFFLSPENKCNYLTEKTSSTLFVDPDAIMNVQTYSALAMQGFRRSGEHLYVPQCEQCQECVPIRIPVDKFQASRSQKRTIAKNKDIRVQRVNAAFSEEHFELYQRYIAGRHSSGEMDFDDPAQYLSFLTSSWADTVFYEFRLEGKLVAVAVMDALLIGYAAVYTFFDPQMAQRSLGRYAILWEIEETRCQALPWLFLGYWIRDCNKMNYKTQYRPAEVFRHGLWQPFDI